MIDSILFWNQVALDAGKTDFSLPDPRPPGLVPQQPGPTFASRALAIVHLAMYDAFVGIRGGGATYLDHGDETLPGTHTLPAAQAAVAAAACLTLIALYHRQKDTLLRKHNEFVATLPGGDPSIAKGIAWGHRVAAAMLAERSNDGAGASEEQYAPGVEAGRHRPDPYSPAQGFLGPLWGKVLPFGFNHIRRALTPLPDPLSLPEYAADFIQVAAKGRKTGSTRTPDQTTVGLFWAYDGARNIGVPPRLYNQLIRSIVQAKGTVTEAQNARLFALANVAMADAGIQAWFEKYRHNLWRPIVGIREADAGWGPTGQGDGHAGTQGDPHWEPLGSPRTNSSGQEAFTPNFPAYPSGHATFGAAALRIVQTELGLADSFAFSFMSDEFNGDNAGATGVRPKQVRQLTLSRAIEENNLSRVYLGVHWLFDCRKGEQLGREIAAKLAAAFPARA